jgi:hypothetical protein
MAIVPRVGGPVHVSCLAIRTATFFIQFHYVLEVLAALVCNETEWFYAHEVPTRENVI